jgi:uncharacterized protein (TIGR00369 family)
MMNTEFPLDGSLFGEGNPCFGCSGTHPTGFRLRYERANDEVITRFVPTALHQGPIGLMHGGLVSTIADETAAWAVIASTGKFGFTTSFSCKLLRAVRIGAEVEARARVSQANTRVVHVSVFVRQHDDTCLTGQFSFILLDRLGAERLLGTALPPAWERFCR